MKNPAYIPAAAILFVAIAMHFCADEWHTYNVLTWYDDPLHFTSGLGLGFLFYWIISEFGIVSGGLFGSRLWAVVGLAFVCGIFWECFEAYTDTAGYPVGSVAYCVDTAKDLINGVVGAVASVIIIGQTFKKGCSAASGALPGKNP